MIAKLYNKTLYTFEKRTGMTAVFTQNELNLVRQYLLNGQQTPFIKRLYNLGIFYGDTKNVLANCLSSTEVYSPQSLHIDITTRCPLNCCSCYKIPNNEVDMSFNMFNKIIDEAESLSIFQIAIGGGDPLYHRNITDFIKRVAQTEMSVTMTTSGFSLNEQKIQSLVDAGINHIQISLNGSTSEINKLSRDGYQHAINALTLLANTSLSYGVNWVARKSNLHDFENLAELAKKYKAENINILRYKPSPHEDYAKESLNTNEFHLLAEKIKHTKGITLKTDSAFSNLLLFINNGNVSKNTCGCGAGKTFVAITPKGEFKPCSHLRLGSNSQSVSEYWNKSADVKLMRQMTLKNEPNTCANCAFEKLCGGCRAICERINSINSGEVNCPTYKNNYA